MDDNGAFDISDAIAFLMFWLKRASFTPFVVYRVILGAALLYYAYGAPGLDIQ